MKHNSSDKRKPIRKLIKARACQHCPKAKLLEQEKWTIRLLAEIFVLKVIISQQKFKLITLSITFLILPHTAPKTLFSNTLKQCSSRDVRNNAAQSHKTCEITVPYILIFMFLNSEKENKIFCTAWYQFQNLMLLISL
jgi:hypothetical protein